MSKDLWNGSCFWSGSCLHFFNNLLHCHLNMIGLMVMEVVDWHHLIFFTDNSSSLAQPVGTPPVRQPLSASSVEGILVPIDNKRSCSSFGCDEFHLLLHSRVEYVHVWFLRCLIYTASLLKTCQELIYSKPVNNWQSWDSRQNRSRRKKSRRTQ